MMETCWNESHSWNTAVEGYKLFRGDRLGRSRCCILCWGMGLWRAVSEKQLQTAWACGWKDKEHTNKGHLVGEIYYRCLTCWWGLLLQLQEASCSQALILMGDFNHPGICWKSNAAACKQSRRLLEHIKGTFQIQVLHKPMREDALVDLVLTSGNELITRVKMEAAWAAVSMPWLGCGLKKHGCAKSKVRTLNFKTVNFQLFKVLVDEIPWETVLSWPELATL